MRVAPNYDLEKIKFATDRSTFERAVKIYESGKIKEFKEHFDGYSAIVYGTHPYHVIVSNRYYDRGHCDCYLGGQDELCKHMVAVAIRAVAAGEPLSNKEKEVIDQPVCSGRLGELGKEEFSAVKKSITSALRYVKAYSGPSKTWFAYQDSLSEGCNRLSAIVSVLPVSNQTASLVVDLLLRLDDKLCRGGVDDSDGTVGGFIEMAVKMLEEYIKLNPKCIQTFKKLAGRSTCFGWEEPLLRHLPI